MEHIHLIGIGGSGLSAIARVLLESGYTVSGSDRILSPLASDLQSAGARVFTGHQAENIAGADIVVRSSAIPDDNPEVVAAMNAGIPVLKRSDFLGHLIAKNSRTSIAVAGTHGKTTTTAMVAWMLTQLEQDPSYIIGGVSKNLGGNAHAGQGDAFVVEADEYDRMFLGLAPDVIVITNVDYDHPDCFPTPTEYFNAFLDFGAKLRAGGTLMVCAEDAGACRLAQTVQALGGEITFYGFDSPAEPVAKNPPVWLSFRVHQLTRNQGGCFDYQAWYYPQDGEPAQLAKVSLQVPGEHNVLNSLAALAVAHRLGLPVQAAASALNTYTGTNRRFDVIGEASGVTLINDYAHHPTEIRTTLAAARSHFPGRQLWAIWQPHTLSRTQAFLEGFSSAFTYADQVIVTGIYGAREDVNPQVQAKLLGSLVSNIPGNSAQVILLLDDVVAFLTRHLHKGDVVLFFSAGDADQASQRLLEILRRDAHV